MFAADTDGLGDAKTISGVVEAIIVWSCPAYAVPVKFPDVKTKFPVVIAATLIVLFVTAPTATSVVI
jgi:hypothetical protein